MATNKLNIKAIFTDLDGTLLGPDHKIGRPALEALKRIREEYNNEIPFIVATGRPYADVFATLTDCHLEPDFIITSNGARIHNKKRELVAKRDLDVDFLRAAIADAAELASKSPAYAEGHEHLSAEDTKKYGIDFHKERQFTVNMYQDDKWLVDIGLPTYATMFHDTFNYKVEGVEGLQQLKGSDLEGIHELFFLGPPAHLVTLKEHLQAKYKDYANITFPLPYMLDCVSSDINKGKALREVAALLGVDPDDVVAFGDGMNDESMLRTAGYPFVMKNAIPALKAALPDVPVIGSNVEAGVVKKLEELLL